LILTTADGAERRLLAELEDKPWAAEDGESWRAAFAVRSPAEIDGADGLELSVSPNINVALRSGGVNADGLIPATGRVSEEPPPTPENPAAAEPQGATAAEPERADPAEPEKSVPKVTRQAAAPEDPDLPFPTSPRRRRARGVPPPASAPAPAVGLTAPEPASEAAAAPVAPRPRPAANRAADLDRLTSRLRSAEATLEREQERRTEVERSLERERGEARRTVAELARARAELELARTAESESADTASQLDAARRDNHELRARHEALRADHDRAQRTLAELEEKLEARTTELREARKELASERRQRRDADSQAAPAADAAPEAGHRPPALHATVHTPPPPRTDRPINPSLRQSPWLRLLVVLVIAGVLLAIYLVLHSTVLH
jgi:hypothetical protein